MPRLGRLIGICADCGAPVLDIETHKFIWRGSEVNKPGWRVAHEGKCPPWTKPERVN